MDKTLEAAERAARANPEDLEEVRVYAAALRQSGWSYKGRGLDDYLKDLEAPKNSKARKLIAEKIGLAAVPGLIDLLAHKGPKVRVAAANSLRRIGAPAIAAVPHLIKLLAPGEKVSARKEAAEALGAIPGEAATRALLGLLQDPNQDVARLAALGLKERNELGDDIAAGLAASYQAGLDRGLDWELREALLGSAAALGRRDDVLAFLSRALTEDPSTDAARALAKIARPEDSEAIAAFEAATRGKEHYVHDIAVKALVGLELGPERLSRVLLAAYEACSSRVRIACCQNMVRFFDSLDPALLAPPLVQALKERPEDSHWLNEVLVLIPGAHDEVAGVFAEKLRSLPEDERRGYIDTVRLSQNPARYELIKRVAAEDPSVEVRAHAVSRLSWIKEADPAEVAALLRGYLEDPAQLVRLWAASGLEEARLGGAETVAALKKACEDPSESVARAARRSLEKQAGEG